MTPERLHCHRGYRLEGPEIPQAVNLLHQYGSVISLLRFDRSEEDAQWKSDLDALHGANQSDAESVWIHRRTGHFLQGLFDMPADVVEVDHSQKPEPPILEHTGKKP